MFSHSCRAGTWRARMPMYIEGRFAVAMDLRLTRWLPLALLALMPASISAASYYVSSSTGNDFNDGLSQQTAWQTLQRVYAKCTSNAPLLPGDHVLLRRGDTWSGEL